MNPHELIEMLKKMIGVPDIKPGQTAASYMREPTIDLVRQAVVQTDPNYPSKFALFKSPEKPDETLIAFPSNPSAPRSMLRITVEEIDTEEINRLENIAALFGELEGMGGDS